MVCPSLSYGGAEKQFVGLTNYLAKAGNNVFVLSLFTREDSEIGWRAFTDNIKIMHGKNDKNKSLTKKYIKTIWQIIKIQRKHKIDVSISFIEMARSATILASKFTKSKCIVSERADPNSRSGKYNKLIFKIFELSNGYVFQTSQAKDFFLDSDKIKKNGTVIPNAIFEDEMPQPYMGERNFRIVSVGRLQVSQKRQDILLKAYKLIEHEFPEYDLYLYGDGPDRDLLFEIAKDNNILSRVHFMGVYKNILEEIKDAGLFVLSSDYEGIPNALIEAMCMGIPCVSTKCSPGGAELLITHGKNGLLAERGSVNDLADKMRIMLIDREKALAMGKEAVKIREAYNSSTVLPKWVAYINKVLVNSI